MTTMGAVARRGLKATANAVQTQSWRCMPTLAGQQSGLSSSCASMQAQPQLDVQDVPTSTAEARGTHGAVELGAIRNDWRYQLLSFVCTSTVILVRFHFLNAKEWSLLQPRGSRCSLQYSPFGPGLHGSICTSHVQRPTDGEQCNSKTGSHSPELQAKTLPGLWHAGSALHSAQYQNWRMS